MTLPDRRAPVQPSPWCAGCGADVRPACAGSLARRHVVKVHWECWSDCNLSCPFCFRTRGAPLGTADARRLVRAVATGGARTVAFAGGDPTLRRDLDALVSLAQRCGLRVEIQTNAHVVRARTWTALRRADRVCLSLDGPTPGLHDAIRGRRGNFRRVVETARALGEDGVAVTVRTLITRKNVTEVAALAPLVARLPTCERWTLLEFTPVGEGFRSRAEHELAPGAFEDAVSAVRAAFTGPAEIDVFRHAEKVGAYAQISPDGGVYGTTEQALFVTGEHDMIGSVVGDHLSDLAEGLPLDARRHAARYAPEVATPAAGAAG